ncbi:MAG: hypothetical protein ACE5ID_04375 [Acidobacteriota bacterium]
MESPSQANLNQRVQQIAHEHLKSLTDELQHCLAEFASPDLAPRPEETTSRALARLAAAVQSLLASKGQRDLAARLLDAAQSLAPRTALFLVRGEICSAHDSRGFDPSRDAAAFNTATQQDDLLSLVLQDGKPRSWSGTVPATSPLAAWLEGDTPDQACLVPLEVGGRPVALLYADTGAEVPGSCLDAGPLEILATVASLYLERLRPQEAVQAPVSSPSARQDAPPEDAFQPPADDGTVADPPAANSMEDAGGSPDISGAHEQQEGEAAGPVDAPAPEPTPAAEATVVPTLDDGMEAVSDGPIPLSTEDSPSELPQEEEDQPILPKVEAADIAPSPPEPEQPPPPEEAADPAAEDARRFARLLVSEVVLYNEAQVRAGQKQGNLYNLLKEPIDRSRQAYRERFGPQMESHFEAELIRLIALDNSSLMGPDYRPS